jgi:hypothetical protein
MEKTTDLVKDIQICLAFLPCPICERGPLDLRLRGGLSWADCVYVAVCECCATEYWIDRDSMPEGSEDHANEVCADCGSPHCRVTLCVDGQSRRWTYAVTHRPCTH